MKTKLIQLLKKKKYLVIGTKIKSKDIVSYEWENIPKDLNLADFNRVIINQYELYKNPQKIKYFNLINQNIYNFIFNVEAEVIVIGIPGTITFENTGNNNSW